MSTYLYQPFEEVPDNISEIKLGLSQSFHGDRLYPLAREISTLLVHPPSAHGMYRLKVRNVPDDNASFRSVSFRSHIAG